jgi:tripartite-type tricarboxylate transporter receptor subunit TctC
MYQEFNRVRTFILCLLTLHVFMASFARPVNGQDNYYKGKTIRIIVGFSPGGGYDTYTRAIARHFGKHIPGNPTIIVENMPGASSLIAANYLYRIAKPDGLSIANIHGNQILNQVLGRPGIEFDARKFEWIGVPVRSPGACALTTASGITDLEKWKASKTPVKLGATSPGDGAYNMTAVVRALFDLPMQMVSGYKGTTEIRLAAEGGEVSGGCWQWDSIKVTWRKALDAGAVKVVLQMAPKPNPDLPKVPLARTLLKTPEQKAIYQAAVEDANVLTRLYVLPPGTPRERVAQLRKAFMSTMRDPAFLAEAEKARLDLDPMSGEEVETLAKNYFQLDPKILAKLDQILK